MDLNKREKIGLITFSVIILTLLSILYFKGQKNSEIQVISKSNSKNISDESSAENKSTNITVYICGEIQKPGVYTILEGDRVEKVIELAGGFTENAYRDNINLAAKLKDEDFIKIPSKNSIIINGTGINPFGSFQSDSGKININTATKEELKNLPRIGDAYAQRIIEYRENKGPFKDLKDIMKVSGIGEKIFENIKDKITVR